MRLLSAVVVLAGFFALTGVAQPDAPLPPTIVKFKTANATLGEVAAEISKASGVPIAVDAAVLKARCPVAVDGLPFWEALERVAAQTRAKLVLAEQGRKIALEPRGASKTVAATSGPFRVVATQVIGRALLDQGVTIHDVHLDVHWEPRYTVFRIDTNPKITRAADDTGRVLESKQPATRVQPEGSVATMTVPLSGLTRQSKQIGVLAGEFRVTAAAKMLTFKFGDLTAKLPQTQTQERVSVSLKRMAKDDAVWVIDLELVYPPGQPAFESFEGQVWLRNNRPRLISPDASKTFEADSYEYDIREDMAGGRKVLATYTFKGVSNPEAKGWSLMYETPAPLVEFTVPFELRNIPIP